MSTHALVGKEQPDGTIRAIRVAGDGGMDDEISCGPTLHAHYQDETKIDALLALGLVTWVGPEIGVAHNLRLHAQAGVNAVDLGWTTAAKRDWGDPPSDYNATLTLDNADAFYTLMQEYTAYGYLWSSVGGWQYVMYRDGSRLLLDTVLTMRDEAETFEMELDDYIRWRRDCQAPAAPPFMFTPPQVMDPRYLGVIAETIGVPVAQWPGNCHYIANLLITHNVVPGTLHYGHWRGPVAAGSPFFGKPIIHHGWIATGDNVYPVVDPTRFVFFAAEPFIYAGDAGCYDSGGNRHRAENRRPAPAYTAQARAAGLVFADEVVRGFVDQLLGKPPAWTADHEFWLANLPPDDLLPFTKEIYEALILCGNAALIPLDNRRIVLGALPTNLPGAQRGR